MAARHRAKMMADDPEKACLSLDKEKREIQEEMAKLREMLGAERFDKGKFALAAELFGGMMTNPTFDEFLTLKAYQYV